MTGALCHSKPGYLTCCCHKTTCANNTVINRRGVGGEERRTPKKKKKVSANKFVLMPKDSGSCSEDEGGGLRWVQIQPGGFGVERAM